MSGLGVALEGLPAVEASVAAVVDALQDPATAAEAANLVRVAASPPRDTGRLADSAQVVGSELVYAVPYSVIVHTSQPWLGDAVSSIIPDLVNLYETRALEAWA